MLFVVLSGLALIVGVPSVLVVAGLAASYLPTIATVAVVVVTLTAVAVRERRKRVDTTRDEGALLRQLAGRIIAGATIRSAIADPTVTAVPASGRRLAAVGMPMSDVGLALSGALPVNGRSFRAICSFSEHTGAAVANALTVLAERSDAATEMARHRRVSLAQAKMSATVVGIVPIVASVALIALKGVPGPGGAVVVVPMAIGLTLQLVGTVIVFNVASRAS